MIVKQIVACVGHYIKHFLVNTRLWFSLPETDSDRGVIPKSTTPRLPESKETFRGVYSTFEEVPNRTGYDSTASLIENRRRTLEEGLRAHTSQTALMRADPRCQINNLIALLIAVRQTPGAFSVLDYGGGMGETFFKISQSTSTDQLDYIIFDKMDTRDAGRAIFANFPSYKVRYIDQICGAAISPDIIYLGSMLQYIPDYKSVLNELCALGAETVVLTDQWVTKSSSFVTSQVNEKGRIIPMWIFNIDSVISHFLESGYRLAYRTSDYQPWVRTGELSPGIAIGDSVNLVFLRAQDSLSP